MWRPPPTLTAEGLLTWHYDPDPGVLLETVGFDREVSGRDGLTVDRQAMHVGWVSGIPWAYALLAHGLRTGRTDEVDAARRVIDFITASLSPSGTFWGVWYRDHGWTQSWTELKRGLHSRTLAEATLFLLRAQALDGHDQWEHAIRSNLDVVVGRQRADGNLGSVHHAETGEVLSWSGASGLTWIAALVEAADRDQRYLPAAAAAGRHYGAVRRPGIPARRPGGCRPRADLGRRVRRRDGLRGAAPGDRRHALARHGEAGGRLDADLPLHVRRRVPRRTRFSAPTASGRAGRTMPHRRTSTCTPTVSSARPSCASSRPPSTTRSLCRAG
ncbi:hypothetical protein ACRAWC_22590 [Leifsonia sp. L25]|uniref:hypothetical protein n=1 Tax=Leifsonia sp. L25 TaxID=3423957 RepID=UPI003D68518D